MTETVTWLTSHILFRVFSFCCFPLSCYSSSITSPVLSEPFSCRPLRAVRVPAHLPSETERQLFTASSPPLVLVCLLSVFCALHHLTPSHPPRTRASSQHRQPVVFCSTNALRSPLQSQLMSKDTKTHTQSADK